jgi:hypothetical protein
MNRSPRRKSKYDAEFQSSIALWEGKRQKARGKNDLSGCAASKRANAGFHPPLLPFGFAFCLLPSDLRLADRRSAEPASGRRRSQTEFFCRISYNASEGKTSG